MEKNAHQQMVTKLDNHQYDEHELIELEAPLPLPYFTNWQSFERCDGQITINGNAYNYVARKYVNNVMIYKCIPNRVQQNIIATKKLVHQLAFGNFTTEKPQKNSTPLSNYFKNLSDYDDYYNNTYHAPIQLAMIKKQYPLFDENTADIHPLPKHPPPDTPFTIA